jgi:Flp pilus assembly protein TadG
LNFLSAKKRTADDRGQSLVEFGLVAFILVMLLLGVVEIGRMVLVYTTVANATRAGARYAIVHGTDNLATVDQIKTVVKNFLSTAPLDTTRVKAGDIVVNYPGDPSKSGSTNCKNPGCGVTVTTTYSYDPLITYFPWPAINLRSTSQGAITF